MKKRTPARPIAAARPRSLPPEFHKLSLDIDRGLREVLRQHRRQLDGPTIDEAKDEEKKLKALQPKLEEQERILKSQPPNEEGTKQFEEELKKRQKGLHDFEDKLDQLKNQGFPEPPDGLDDLVQSFEDLLRDQEKLLDSFEDLLKRFQPCPIGLLVSFEKLLDDLIELLLSFMHVANLPTFGFRFSSSFEDLLKGLMKLLKSFEDLIKRDHPKSEELIASFSALLGNNIGRPMYDLLNGFATLFMGGDPDLIASFIDVLKLYAGLLGSFEGIVRGTAKAPDPALIRQFEDRVADFEDLLQTLETEIKNLAPPNKPLTERFEELLHLLCRHSEAKPADPAAETSLLDSLEDLVKRNPTPALIKSFEDRLHTLVDLLKSFEDMVGAIPEVPLIESFEHLVHHYNKLRESFADLVKDHGGGDPGFAKSMTDLNKGHQDLLTSLEKLKGRVEPPIPEELLRSNTQAFDEALARQPEFLATLTRARQDPMIYVDSLVRCEKLLLDLTRLLERQMPLSRKVLTQYRHLVSTLGGLIAHADGSMPAVKRRSPYLLEALEDLHWLHGQLAERAKRVK